MTQAEAELWFVLPRSVQSLSVVLQGSGHKSPDRAKMCVLG
jgi:hypothetical protein